MKRYGLYLFVILSTLTFEAKAQGQAQPYFMHCFLSVKVDGDTIFDPNRYDLSVTTYGGNQQTAVHMGFENNSFWSLRICGDYTTDETFSLQLYDKLEDKMYDFCNYDLKFSPLCLVGKFNDGAPINFSSRAIKAGDLNGDGKISASDISLIVGQILQTTNLKSTVSDINQDGATTSTDLSILISMILNPNK